MQSNMKYVFIFRFTFYFFSVLSFRNLSDEPLATLCIFQKLFLLSTNCLSTSASIVLIERNKFEKIRWEIYHFYFL